MLTYTIVVTNDGSADGANVTMTDGLPADLLNPTATATNRAATTITNGTLTATKALFTHAAPNSFTVTVTGTLTPGTNTVCDTTDTGQSCDADAIVHVNRPVPPAQPAAPAPATPELPFTGAATWLPVQLGVLLVACSLLLVAARTKSKQR